MMSVTGNTFYIETFGCQMNAHDSEKVIGTLMAKGYAQVETPEEASLVLYNTCSIRDKAEQKVFNRLQSFKRAGKGKVFGVLGCVAQQEGEKIFDRAPACEPGLRIGQLHAVCRKCWCNSRRATGASPASAWIPTKRSIRLSRAATIRTGRTSPSSKAATNRAPIAWCRSRAVRSAAAPAPSVIEEARRLAESGYTEIQLLGQNVNSYRDPSPAGWDFATLLARVGEVPGIRRVRYTTSHPRDFTKAIVDAMDANPNLCDHVHLPVQSGSSRMLQAMDRLYTRDQYMERIGWIKGARRNISLTTDIIIGFPGETEEDFQATMDLLDEVQYDSLFSFKYSPRPNTAALTMDGQIAEEEKTRRIMALLEKQRAIQIRRNSDLIGRVEEVLVEGRHESLGQWIGRTSQNRVLNFTHPETPQSLLGLYLPVLVTRAGPNSLVGDSLVNVV